MPMDKRIFLGLTLALAGAGARAQPAAAYYPAPGAARPYSAAVRAGDVVYLSGQLGLGADGKPAAGGFAAEVRQAMDHVAAAAKLAGTSMDKVFKCTAMLAGEADWASFNTVYASYFKPARLPARSAFAVASLPAGARIEIECLAYAREP